MNKKEKCSNLTIIEEEEQQVEQAQINTEVQDEVHAEENQATGTLGRQRFVSARLAGHEITPDSEVNEEGEFVRFALLADSEPINFEVVVNEKVWKNAMNKNVWTLKIN